MITSYSGTLRAAIAAILLGTACSAWAGSAYQIENTAFGPPVPLDSSSGVPFEIDQWAFGLNDRGQVVSQTVGLYGNGYSVTNYVSSAGGVSPVTGSVLGTQNHPWNGGGSSIYASVGGINNNGQIAASVASTDAFGQTQFYGVIRNADGSTKILPSGTAIGGDNLALNLGAPSTTNGLNNRGDVAGTVRLGDGTLAPFFEAAAASSPSVIASPLGFGGIGNAVNLSGQVTGGLFTGAQSPNINAMPGADLPYPYANTQAFLTNANGSGMKLLGTANGVASVGLCVNDSGQVGGELLLASGQTEAFLSTRAGTIVGLGAGKAGDSTATLFVNNLGQAIIRDFTGTYDPATDSMTPGGYYLYSGGKIIPIASLLPADMVWGNNEAVTGLNNNGDILIGDPMVLAAPNDWTSIGESAGAIDVTSTDVYLQVAAAQGGAGADASFLATPGPSPASVPEPAALGLLGLGAWLARRRRARGSHA